MNNNYLLAIAVLTLFVGVKLVLYYSKKYKESQEALNTLARAHYLVTFVDPKTEEVCYMDKEHFIHEEYKLTHTMTKCELKQWKEEAEEEKNTVYSKLGYADFMVFYVHNLKSNNYSYYKLDFKEVND